MDDEQKIENPAAENETRDDEDIDAGDLIDEEPAEDPIPPDEVAAVVEAILFSSNSPLPISKITATAELPTSSVRAALGRLNARYERQGAAFRIEELAGGFQILTLPEYNDVLRRLLSVKKDSRLTQASMETLAIIAYRQPILRADIEAIRGVATGDILRGLMEKQLVKIVGRAEVIGRPMLYGTTKKFLEVFGLAKLDDLPRVEELRNFEQAGRTEESKESEENEEEFDEQGDEESQDKAGEQADDAANDQ